ncbi:hypothetical protein SLEP1_g6169 [Rubroshorea leprosula]|uniref:Trehalose-6-phosphate synthase n=1 Tax=Rubroshorea leprosula TaxID=152421 RepID=A0AAV5I0L5_9ROSI|nr:hypothetical protein SLEP1_g6169 [Rubroshorea leprosula]
MLGVDWLDMIKGIPQKILAFEKFLEENPNWRSKVVLLQIAIPSRTNVPECMFLPSVLHSDAYDCCAKVTNINQKFTSQVHEIVGCINGKYGTITAVPIHHLFAGAAQSLGSGAILVNPWNITEVASSIGKALEMSADEREQRYHHNYMHVTTHSAQEWAATFISELNDTIVEANLRITHVPPALPIKTAVDCYFKSKNRVLILGFNTTLTEPVDGIVRTDSQIKEMELKLHPALREPLKTLCDDPKTTIIVLSGSGRNNFNDYKLWLAAENGMFLRSSLGEWKNTMPENLNHVFKYFTERTPRSHFEFNETTLNWNYKYADHVFGRLQARDLLQHLWTGPISNAPVEVVLGSQSVEVRPVGFSKGAVIDRILGDIIHGKCMKESVDYLLCIGHFLVKDEDIYTFFESGLSAEAPMPDKTSASKSPQKEGVEGGMPVSLELFEVETANYFSCAVARMLLPGIYRKYW